MTDDRFADLKPGEPWAMQTAERILGARADPDYYGPRSHSATDAAMLYPDGRVAAFEIIGADQDHARQKDRLLGHDDHEWVVPEDVQWWWTVRVGDRRDIPRLKMSYRHIMRVCEMAGAERPEDLHRVTRGADPEVRWLVRESTSQMRGAAAVPAREGNLVRQVMVVLTPRHPRGAHTSLAAGYSHQRFPRSTATVPGTHQRRAPAGHRLVAAAWS